MILRREKNWMKTFFFSILKSHYLTKLKRNQLKNLLKKSIESIIPGKPSYFSPPPQ